RESAAGSKPNRQRRHRDALGQQIRIKQRRRCSAKREQLERIGFAVDHANRALPLARAHDLPAVLPPSPRTPRCSTKRHSLLVCTKPPEYRAKPNQRTLLESGRLSRRPADAPTRMLWALVSKSRSTVALASAPR